MANTEHAWLVDASIYVFRAWFTRPEYLNVKGQNVNAALGFKDFVDDLLKRENPDHIGFAFDESLQSSHRKTIYPAYKANRESAPENLRYQFQLCRRYIRALGIVEAASKHYEADDVIAAWSRLYERVTIVTADKDLTQLLRENDRWWDYQKEILLDVKGVIKKFGVRPDQIADQLALAGDKADNIPGVPGVGMTTAARLLRKFDTIDGVLASVDDIAQMKFRGAARIKTLILEHEKEIKQYRQVTRVCYDVPDLITNLSRSPQNSESFDEVLLELE